MKYCPECGTKLVIREHPEDGPVAWCPTCQDWRYPGFNVAVSMEVLSPDRQRVVLIDQYGKHGILVAGYVARGESLDQTVRREVREETGLEVGDIAFNASRFFEPSNTLMVNFSCVAESEELHARPGEVNRAAWYSFDDARAYARPNSLAKAFLLHYLDGTDLDESLRASEGRRNRTVYLAGGCFWGVEELFRQMPGVVATKVGFANGDPAIESPSYERVCKGDTGYKECVRVTFDPAKTSTEALLYAYFRIIDPTLVNRQGADRGTQYQAGVFWGDDVDVKLAVERVCAIERTRCEAASKPFHVLVEPLKTFWDAEEYHQRYLVKNPGGYCHVSPTEMRKLVSSPMPEGYYDET